MRTGKLNLLSGFLLYNGDAQKDGCKRQVKRVCNIEITIFC